MRRKYHYNQLRFIIHMILFKIKSQGKLLSITLLTKPQSNNKLYE